MHIAYCYIFYSFSLSGIVHRQFIKHQEPCFFMMTYLSIGRGLLINIALSLISISLIDAAVNWNGNNWALGCDFSGNDLKNVQTSSDRCGGTCAQTKGCTHFAWSNHNGGTCWMKQGSVSRNNAFQTSDQSMVCGVMDNASGGGSSSGNQGGSKVAGITTRYWDCCKSSCSWPGKVSGTDSKVKICRRDGYASISDANARSGCDGGDAFICNNQIPWAVNDQLAYGFAAATIPGLDESRRCCACYKLDFTSGPVQGKSMIVQVTNSGSDVHPNQFDLQIPGGGVGIFNGCSGQWGAGRDGWGQRYGGVSSRDQCSWLPEQIRQGCLFRFDWFRGADNPSMVYSRVKCPQEIIAVTGCKRNDE